MTGFVQLAKISFYLSLTDEPQNGWKHFTGGNISEWSSAIFYEIYEKQRELQGKGEIGNCSSSFQPVEKFHWRKNPFPPEQTFVGFTLMYLLMVNLVTVFSDSHDTLNYKWILGMHNIVVLTQINPIILLKIHPLKSFKSGSSLIFI